MVMMIINTVILQDITSDIVTVEVITELGMVPYELHREAYGNGKMLNRTMMQSKETLNKTK